MAEQVKKGSDGELSSPTEEVSDKQQVKKSSVSLGELTVRTLFTEFTTAAQRKIQQVMAEPLELPLSKSLQRGEDPEFDQLLVSLNAVAEHCLPSLMKTLLMWYIRQNGIELDCPLNCLTTKVKSLFELSKLNTKDKVRDVLTERRDMAVDFLLCLVLIEILKKLPVYPVPDYLVQLIEDLAFKHFIESKSYNSSESQHNGQLIADLYAEVLGVLSQGRSQLIRKRFLKELKGEQSLDITVSVVMGMRFCSLKMFPVEELEASFLFMQDCAAYFNEARSREVRHAMAAMMVELLVPVAGMVKREVNVPAMKNFVEMLYFNALDMAKKSRHVSAMFPLVTVLLCISQKSFFLANWGVFLNMCLPNLKHRVVTTQRIALESLYRSMWVYMIRIKGEGNNTTHNRLRTIMEALFPRGSRNVVPRNMPLNIHVRIIQYIAQERLDFAFKEIISDLLGVNKISKQFVISPERMTIGLRAFLIIADQLEQKESPPPMPSTIGMLPSGNLLRAKKSYLNTTLTETGAKSLGIGAYFYGIRKALDCILRVLDSQIGRSMSLANAQLLHKEVDDLISERKAKIELFRTCVAAIPRCLPEGMTKLELANMVSRLTVHVDNELRSFALSSLQTLLLHFPDWTEVLFKGYVNFITKDVPDTNTDIVHNTLRVLYQLLTNWKSTVFPTDDHSKKHDKSIRLLNEHSKNINEHVFHCLEGLGLVMLCSISSTVRKLAIALLKEVRSIIDLVDKHSVYKVNEQPVIEVIDSIGASILETCVAKIAGIDKEGLNAMLLKFDLQWLSDKASSLVSEVPIITNQLPTSIRNISIKENEALESINFTQRFRCDSTNTSMSPWISFLVGLFDQYNLPKHCCTASMYAWLILQTRTQSLNHIIDSSLKKTSLTISTLNKNDILLYQYYLMLSCACCTPSIIGPKNTCISDQIYGVSADLAEKSESSKCTDPIQAYLKSVLALLRHDSEIMSDAAISALGRCNAVTFKNISSEMSAMLKERADKQKVESVRKRRKRDPLRVKFVKIFEIAAENGCFVPSNFTVDKYAGLSPVFVDYIETTRCYLEMEGTSDVPALCDLRLHFCNFLRNLINEVPGSCRSNLLNNDIRRSLFFLFASWSGEFGKFISDSVTDVRPCRNYSQEILLSALEAMSGIACCGPVFDPSGIEKDGYLYNWLDAMITCNYNYKIYEIGCKTVELLLAYNDSCHNLLTWVNSRCLTAPSLTSRGLFKAFVNVFTGRNYPIRLIQCLNVVLFKSMDPDEEVRGWAIRMLHILDKRYFSIYRESIGLNEFSSSDFSMTILEPEAHLSSVMAKLHLELTIPIASEMTSSILSANSAGRSHLLINLLPWVYNIELVDNHVRESTMGYIVGSTLDKILQVSKRLQGEGWGSVDATQLILCNLFYISAKYSDEHARELASIWSVLAAAWPRNLRVIINFLCIIAGLGLNAEILSYIKTIILFIRERKPEKIIEELMQDLRLVENLTYSFESSDNAAKQLAILIKTKSLIPQDEDQKSESTSDKDEVASTKKLCALSDFINVASAKEEGFYKTIQRDGKYETEFSSDTSTVKEGFLTWAKSWFTSLRNANGKSVPLPAPSDLLVYAPLHELFANDGFTLCHFRCHFSMMLISEILLNRITFDSCIHLPLLLHVICLGMDHLQQVVSDHCKCLLLRIVLLMYHQDRILDIDTFVKSHPFTTDILDSPIENIRLICRQTKVTSGETLIADVKSNASSTEEFSKAEKLIEYILLSGHKPLWQCEEITPRNMLIKSIDSLDVFVNIVIDAFSALPSCKELKYDWGLVALQWATSCSSRHYAGRSFQVLRSLCVPLNWTSFSDILSRLRDTATDLNEDVQGYVLEILLTLEAAVDARLAPIKEATEEKLSKPNSGTSNNQTAMFSTASRNYSSCRKSRQRNISTISSSSFLNLNGQSTSTSRSGSISRVDEESKNEEFLENTNGAVADTIRSKPESNLCEKEYSENYLFDDNEIKQLVTEESQDLLARIFWACVCLLESDYEHEFLVAVRIISKIIKSLQYCKRHFNSKLQGILNQMEWTTYPGLHALLLKGLTISSITTATLDLLSWLTPDSDNKIIDPSQRVALPLSIVAVLPYLCQSFDSPDDFCTSCAESFGLTCRQYHNLSNIATLFKLYHERKYPKPCQVWLSAMCQYLHDAYPDLVTTILTFLLEVLEFCSENIQKQHLQVIQSYIKDVDLSLPEVQQWGSELVQAICRSLTGSYWEEALEIIKLVVAKSSSVHQPHDTTEPRALWHLDTFGGMVKKELPGPTLNFNFDLSRTKVIGFSNNLYPIKTSHSSEVQDNDIDDEVKIEKMIAAQNRTRSCLRRVMATCGNKSALMKNSYQSIVFSSTSSMQTFDRRQTLEQSSSDEALIIDEVGRKTSDYRRRSFIGVVTDFDFLDDEYKASEEVNSSPFNWASMSILHSHSTESVISTTPEEINLRNDLAQLASACREIFESSDDESQSTVDDKNSVKSIEVNAKVDLTEPEVTDTTDNPVIDVDRKCSIEVEVVDVETERLSESGTEGSPHSCRLTTDKTGSRMSISSVESSIGVTSEDTCRLENPAFDINLKEVMEVWQMHISTLLTNKIGNKTTYSHTVFFRTYSSIVSNFERLVQKSNEVALVSEFYGIGSTFIEICQIFDQIEFPFAFADWDILVETGFIHKYTFLVLEMHTYCKPVVFLSDKLWGKLDDFRCENVYNATVLNKLQESRLQMCEDLYQMAFNINLLLETYTKYIRELNVTISKAEKAINVAEDVNKCRTSLIKVMNSMDEKLSNASSLSDDSMNSKFKALCSLEECLEEDNHSNAIRLLHIYRQAFNILIRKWPSDIFGRKGNDDIGVLLSIYFKCITRTKQGIAAIEDKAEELLEKCYSPIQSTLLELLKQLNDIKHEFIYNDYVSESNNENGTFSFYNK